MFKFDSEGDRPRDGREEAPPLGAASVQDVLARVLGAAPFGIEVASAGRTLYSNHEHAAWRGPGNAEGAEETKRARRFDIACGVESYELSLVLDESEQLEAERDLIQRAWFDELTGLPNRGLMERSIRALIADGAAAFGLLFIDLDGFKHVNDYYGHAVGDQLLRRLAERLAANLRRSDLLARLSGDEFVLLVSPIADVEALAVDVDWLSQRIKEPFVIDGNEVCTSASIGVSVYPDHGATYDQLLSNADRAMYRGKSRTKGAVTFFDSSIEHAVAEKTRLEQRLRLAIRDRRVCCAYQPKVDLRSGEVSGVEVLMRWRDEDGLIQPPGDFLSLAIELGLMDDLTHFILAETVSSIDRINDAFGRDCSISVNVAARQAGNTEFMRSLVAALADTGFADRFMLELTEEAFLSTGDFQAKVLPMIRAIGSRVSIDDFGVGYSSLSALADITADEIKVDRSFISEVHRRPRSQSILRAIEALGHSLGMSIVVEGVETFEELAYLQAATRINCAQGYYFSKPMLLEDLGPGTVRESELRSGATGRELRSNRIIENRARLLGR
jgi:diguanylate cyclase (GGDEF)-like protein